MKGKLFHHYVKDEDFDFTKKSTSHNTLYSGINLYLKDCSEESFILTGISILLIAFFMITLFLVSFHYGTTLGQELYEFLLFKD